jgi:hypothetical protein
MKELKVPGIPSVFTTDEASEEMQRVIDSRHAFAVAYAKAKGWPEDLGALTMKQILEIRSQDGWKTP